MNETAQNFPKARERLEDLKRNGGKAAMKPRERISRSKVGKQNEGECAVMWRHTLTRMVDWQTWDRIMTYGYEEMGLQKYHWMGERKGNIRGMDGANMKEWRKGWSRFMRTFFALAFWQQWAFWDIHYVLFLFLICSAGMDRYGVSCLLLLYGGKKRHASILVQGHR